MRSLCYYNSSVVEMLGFDPEQKYSFYQVSSQNYKKGILGLINLFSWILLE